MTRTTNRTHWHLLTTVSAFALLGSVCGAAADDTDRPLLWIEAGGQLDMLNAKQDPYAPSFVAVLDTNPFTKPESLQQLPRYATGENGKISFQPDGSDWIFSASLQYGRSSGGNKHVHQETTPPSPQISESIAAYHFYRTFHLPARAERFNDTLAHETEKHAIIDFQAGKDIGLGLFDGKGTSTVSAGVRFAQFSSRSSVVINADPDFTVAYKYITHFITANGHIKFPRQHWHLYAAQEELHRNFNGVGPTVSWDASVPLVGNPQSEDITMDWGLNAAILFGRQKVHGTHHTSAHYISPNHFSGAPPLVYDHHGTIDRSHSVSVPNVGGFAGLSLRFPNAKVSIGYRADLFFGAMDGGQNVAKTEDRGFYGPFASISVGLGD